MNALSSSGLPSVVARWRRYASKVRLSNGKLARWPYHQTEWPDPARHRRDFLPSVPSSLPRWIVLMRGLVREPGRPAAQVELAEPRVGEQLGRRARHVHPAEVEDAADIGGLERAPGVLLDEQHRRACRAHARDLLEH